MQHALNDQEPNVPWRELFQSDEMEQFLDARVSRIIRDFLGNDRVCSGVDFGELSHAFQRSEIGDSGVAPLAYLDALDDRVIVHATNTASPYFIGHMTSALPSFVRPLSRLVAALNQNVVKVETARSFTPFEREALAMLHRLVFDRDHAFYQAHIQARDSTLGAITGGGTTANLMALWIARNTALGPRDDFPGAERAGLAAALVHHGYRRAVLVGSTLMHYSLDKSAAILGLGMDGVIRLPVNERGAVDPAVAREAITACRERGDCVLALIGVAGATDCGAVDPLNELSDVARETGTHFHVDAAWGGPVLFSNQHRHLLQGIERADSVTLDGHKQLYLPMGIGMLLLRDPHAARVIEKQAKYIIRADSADIGRRTVEGSRPSMAMLLHAALGILGRSGYQHLIDEGIRKARHLAEQVSRRPELELLLAPMLNIVNYRYIPASLRDRGRPPSAADNARIDQINAQIQETQEREGRMFVSRTTLSFTGHDMPVVALRAILANPLTTPAHIDAVLEDQVRIGDRLA